MTTYQYDRAARRRSQFLARTEWLKPDWPVVPDAKVVIVPGRSSGVMFSVITRALKQYVELAPETSSISTAAPEARLSHFSRVRDT